MSGGSRRAGEFASHTESAGFGSIHSEISRRPLAGLGCGLVNPLTAEPYLNAGLILKPFEPSIYFRTLLLMPPNRRPSRLLKEIVIELKNYSNGKIPPR